MDQGYDIFLVDNAFHKGPAWRKAYIAYPIALELYIDLKTTSSLGHYHIYTQKMGNFG